MLLDLCEGILGEGIEPLGVGPHEAVDAQHRGAIGPQFEPERALEGLVPGQHGRQTRRGRQRQREMRRCGVSDRPQRDIEPRRIAVRATVVKRPTLFEQARAERGRVAVGQAHQPFDHAPRADSVDASDAGAGLLAARAAELGHHEQLAAFAVDMDLVGKQAATGRDVRLEVAAPVGLVAIHRRIQPSARRRQRAPQRCGRDRMRSIGVLVAQGVGDRLQVFAQLLRCRALGAARGQGKQRCEPSHGHEIQTGDSDLHAASIRFRGRTWMRGPRGRL
ncbi:MAG: hypothetical protein JF591_01590 [Lysobacter sp.]|nr:hypothetical protein [Lysobacter sp.]